MPEVRDEPTFETLLREFDEAVTSLECDNLSLESALSQYETAVKLAEQCAQILRTAELRITEIEQSLEDIESASAEG